MNEIDTLFDFGAPAVRQNPYPHYARLRREAPITRAKAPFLGDVIVVSRYEDVRAGMKHPLLSSDMRRADDGPTGLLDSRWVPRIFSTLQDSMVLMDDPEHRRLRDLVHIAFTPRRVGEMAGQVERLADRLLDEMAGKARVDLLAAFALPIPLSIISDMMAVPEKDRLRFHRWSARFLEVASGDPLVVLRQFPNGWRLMRFLERLIAERREVPGDDLLSALIAAEHSGERLSADELLSMVFLLLLAGHETTVNLIGNGMLALMEFPDQLAKLHAAPELIDGAIEELLRYANPVEHGSTRYALDDLRLGDTDIPRGSTVLLLLSSANRDEAVFENPDRVDITRAPNKHVGFGYGVHYCLGAPLARLEGRIAIQKLVARFPNIRPAVPIDQLEWRHTTAVRGLRSLPVLLR